MPEVLTAARDLPFYAGNGSAGNGSGEINRILRSIPRAELDSLSGDIEPVALRVKDLLYEPGEPLKHVYFPEAGVISLLTLMDNGDVIEAMTVGKEGTDGLPVFHGLPGTGVRGICQVSGAMKRMTAECFREFLAESAELRRLLHRYSQYVFESVSQSAACNRLHVIEKRCARWLLMTHDRVGRDEFNLTQEFLAEMLAVRRPGVTVAIGLLESAGLIGHTRGSIKVIDRGGLERASCECYRVIREKESALLS